VIRLFSGLTSVNKILKYAFLVIIQLWIREHLFVLQQITVHNRAVYKVLRGSSIGIDCIGRISRINVRIVRSLFFRKARK
jgi:hypothetical protein